MNEPSINTTTDFNVDYQIDIEDPGSVNASDALTNNTTSTDNDASKLSTQNDQTKDFDATGELTSISTTTDSSTDYIEDSGSVNVSDDSLINNTTSTGDDASESSTQNYQTEDFGGANTMYASYDSTSNTTQPCSPS